MDIFKIIQNRRDLRKVLTVDDVIKYISSVFPSCKTEEIVQPLGSVDTIGEPLPKDAIIAYLEAIERKIDRLTYNRPSSGYLRSKGL